MSEGSEQLMRVLTTQTKESIEADYSLFHGVSHADMVLENLLRTKLTGGGHTANIRESVEATVRAGSGTGECIEQELMKTGLTGWT